MQGPGPSSGLVKMHSCTYKICVISMSITGRSLVFAKKAFNFWWTSFQPTCKRTDLTILPPFALSRWLLSSVTSYAQMDFTKVLPTNTTSGFQEVKPPRLSTELQQQLRATVNRSLTVGTTILYLEGAAAYQLGNISSRTITEVKQRWARLALGWDTVQVLPECCC